MSRYTMLEESKMNEIGLKACPFCGGEARFIKTWIAEYVQCKKNVKHQRASDRRLRNLLKHGTEGMEDRGK